MPDTPRGSAAGMSPDDFDDMDELCGLTFPLHRTWRRVRACIEAWFDETERLIDMDDRHA